MAAILLILARNAEIVEANGSYVCEYCFPCALSLVQIDPIIQAPKKRMTATATT
jgi:hypothetical protein